MVFFLPIQSEFKYNFEENKYWQYPDLYAEFGFPLVKSSKQLERERFEIINNFSPYYYLNLELLNDYSKLFDEYLNKIQNLPDTEKFVSQKSKYHDLGFSKIKEILEKGIIDTAENAKTIYIVEGNRITLRDKESLFSEARASAFLLDALKSSSLESPEIIAPFLENLLKINAVLDSGLTNMALNEELEKIIPFIGVVEKGELIISKGEPIKGETFVKLNSLKDYYEKQELTTPQVFYTIFGFFLLSGIILLIFYVYIKKLYPYIINHSPSLIFILMWFPILGAMLYISTAINNWSPYWIPLAIAPVIIKNFFNSRLAFFTHIVNLILCSFIITPGFEFLFTQIIAGTLVILVINDTYNWNVYLKSIFIIFIGYSLSYLGLNFLKGLSVGQIDLSFFKWIAINSFFTLMAFPLIPILEKIFGFVSTGKLTELLDFNHPLVMQLSSKAPGTFQHSIQVSLLAEAASRKVGCNTLLVKTGALYHDIGKTFQPDFFIENINKNQMNPHNQLTPSESATQIIDHVKQGLYLGEKYKLPKVILDFIETHHGTSLVHFFYQKARSLDPENIDDGMFRYKGPLPITKEQTILMLADSLEAASRTLGDNNPETINNFVEKIISYKIGEEQLYQSELTFSELSEIKKVFIENLKALYHQRIVYPS